VVRVEGRLGLGHGGEGVPGAWVYWEGEGGGFAVRTGEGGRFALYLPPGRYDLWAEGEGLAQTRVEGLRVGPGTPPLRLLALPPFRPGWPRTAPQVLGEVLGTEAGVRYRAGVVAAGGLPPLALLVGLGHAPGGLNGGAEARFYLEEAQDTGERVLLPQGLSGPTELVLVGYDANNNRTERRLPLFLPGEDRPGPPQGLRAVAYTLARPLEVLGWGPTATFVRLLWGGAGGPYRLWRREAGGWVLLAQLPPGSGEFVDTGPAFLPGEEVCYRLEGGGGAAWACTRPLPPLAVEVVEPAPEASLPPTPTFRWRVLGEAPPVLRFQGVVWNQLTGQGLFLPATSGTEAALPPPHPPDYPYAFELWQAYGADDPQDPRAYAVAADRQGTLSGRAVPGPVVPFTVTP